MRMPKLQNYSQCSGGHSASGWVTSYLYEVTRRRIRILILTGLLSISGTLGLQLVWLRQALDLREREFNDRVIVALTEVVDEIQSMRSDSAVVEPVRQSASNTFVANLNDTLHPFLLEALLRESFDRSALNSPFDYAIYDCFSDSMVYGGHVGKEQRSQTPLPRFDRDGHYFGIRFSDRRSDIVMELDRWLLASALQLLVLGTFVYAVVILLRQKRLSEVREDFINNMTHEFKTPIATIESGVQLLQRDDVMADPEARSRYLQLIRTENARLQAQVEKVMEMASLDQGSVQLHSETIPPNTWVEKAVDAFRPAIETAGGRLELSMELGPTSKAIVGDRTHLDGVLSNLLDNAVRYSGDAPPQVDVTMKWQPSDQEGWTITVGDRGIGVPTEHRERIFERFHRVPTGDRHDVKGFGLGLHYVRTIVHAHGGQIACQPREGGGTEFVLFLPSA